MSQWYYAANGQQAGPVDESELKNLSTQGTVKPDTLIWKEGMADWKPFSEVFAEAGASAPAPSGASPASGSSESAAATTSVATSTGGFGAPQAGTKAAELGLKYDFGDILCWGVAITLVPCIGFIGYIALMVLFVLEFLELKKLVDAGKLSQSQYSKVHPALLLVGLFCCSIIFYPLFMHWRNQTGVFKPQPHAVWFAIVIMLGSIAISILLNGASVFADVMSQMESM